MIEFKNGMFGNFAAVQAASTQVGSDVLITFDVANTILIKNATVASLHANDFMFS